MSTVLQLLQFQPRSVRDAQQRGPCPVHGSKSPTSSCFSVQLDGHIFHCFKCGRSGNGLDLWAAAPKPDYNPSATANYSSSTTH
ncbi:MAG: CHC2 zinc finger domain-containing protein [Pirellulales bacterium]